MTGIAIAVVLLLAGVAQMNADLDAADAAMRAAPGGQQEEAAEGDGEARLHGTPPQEPMLHEASGGEESVCVGTGCVKLAYMPGYPPV